MFLSTILFLREMDENSFGVKRFNTCDHIDLCEITCARQQKFHSMALVYYLVRVFRVISRFYDMVIFRRPICDVRSQNIITSCSMSLRLNDNTRIPSVSGVV
ncbi:hypothetical protein RF11_15852 [Thelohanellus kitauei]|uniref:Uncharacterized protein n=1 Tax=Thelohanellus kitauei TaxID=669202 RepID=A0A0C2IY48_THEKT|nr:hypothetical protein RF11_15852 [Thelohanellus kitauei]